MEININCDLGEKSKHHSNKNDPDLLEIVNSANIACGYHAGDEETMNQVVKISKKNGVSSIKIPFKDLEPARRAKPVRLPLSFDPTCINRFQLLHSKFGQPGKMNSGFFAGPIKILIKSISAYS